MGENRIYDAYVFIFISRWKNWKKWFPVSSTEAVWANSFSEWIPLTYMYMYMNWYLFQVAKIVPI